MCTHKNHVINMTASLTVLWQSKSYVAEETHSPLKLTSVYINFTYSAVGFGIWIGAEEEDD